MRVRPAVLVGLALSLVLSGTTDVRASQQLGHVFMALTAAEGAPEPLRSALLENVDSFVAGATGPDIALITFPVEERLGWRHPGDWPHCYQTGHFSMNLLVMAENPAEAAFVWGWMTHTVVDGTIHPLVNAYGGYYTGDTLTDAERKRAKDRHLMLELFDNRHVIELARGRAFFPESHRVEHERVPVDLVAAAYFVTCGYWADGLVARLWSAARAMEVTTESFLHDAGVASPRRSSSGWLTGVPAWFLGDVPTAAECELLMNPLVIENVDLVDDGGVPVLEARRPSAASSRGSPASELGRSGTFVTGSSSLERLDGRYQFPRFTLFSKVHCIAISSRLTFPVGSKATYGPCHGRRWRRTSMQNPVNGDGAGPRRHDFPPHREWTQPLLRVLEGQDQMFTVTSEFPHLGRLPAFGSLPPSLKGPAGVAIDPLAVSPVVVVVVCVAVAARPQAVTSAELLEAKLLDVFGPADRAALREALDLVQANPSLVEAAIGLGPDALGADFLPRIERVRAALK